MAATAHRLDQRKVFEAAKETNVFVIMRYRPGAAFKAIEHTIKTTLDRYGLKAVLAKDFQFEDQLGQT